MKYSSSFSSTVSPKVFRDPASVRASEKRRPWRRSAHATPPQRRANGQPARARAARVKKEPPAVAVAVGVPCGDLELYASVTHDTRPPPRRPSLSRLLIARLKHLSSQPRHRLQPLLVHGSTGPANAGKARSLSSSLWGKKKQSWSLSC